MLNILKSANQNLSKIAIIQSEKQFTYQNLLEKSQYFAQILLAENESLNGKRVGFMVAPGFDYVVAQWAIWQAGGVSVPLSISYPLPALEYAINNTEAEILVADSNFRNILGELAENKKIKFIEILEYFENRNFDKKLPEIELNSNAMILFTSGTTNLPKGVVTTHANIEAQVTTLIEAWQWSSHDHILCVLPLHHVHGIINVVSCALWAGATVEFQPNFSEESVFKAFMKADINVFMAVPTIYFKLISYFEKQDIASQQKISDCLLKFRLMVSGSAALPISVLEKWKEISGHVLLERYGMTEIGMGVSNPYLGERKAGYIGLPLNGVEVRLVDENGDLVKPEEAGEIQIKGPSVFKEYWKNELATTKAFTADGWFKTGDIAVVNAGYYKILGRDSIDIIKSGGYKISAIEIEEVLRTHENIIDCSVLGVPNEEWGELVAAALILNNNDLDINKLNEFMRTRLPAYKCPRNYKILAELPKNAMGKVVKNELKGLFVK